jgi:hypothetical protein
MGTGYIYLFAVLASALFTVSLLFVRERVRSNRQRLIAELGALFFPKGSGDTVPAFDYICAKYEMPSALDRASHRSGEPPRLPGCWWRRSRTCCCAQSGS